MRLLDMSDQRFAQLMIEIGIVSSRTEWKRLFDQDAISFVARHPSPQSLLFGLVFRVGKKRFFAI